ncbi:MAG: acyl-CoA dehydrogenase family protein [Bdellovibrionales bacterium]|nr:acyl-CoA dehydrogenase family protein [Bdellovibrionales bacterium]
MSTHRDPTKTSPTEPLGEDHGKPSFAKGLFSGLIQDEQIFPFPEMPREEAESVRMIIETVEKFAKDHIDTKKIDEAGTLSPEIMQGLKDLGLFGMLIPQEYGGLGLSATAYARMVECLAGIDGSIAVTVGAHQSIGLKGILLAASEEQKRRYLPDLATGKKIAAFALTEQGSGSDAQSMKTEAKRVGDKWILNGSKLWITNGGFADVFTVFAKTETTRNGTTAPRVSAFIVDGNAKGFTRGPEEKKLGIKGSSTVALFFDNVEIPASNLLGEEGRGFKLAMEILNSGRMGLAAGSVGGMKKLLKFSVAHAQERKQFGQSIGEFGMIKMKIADMVIDTYVAESITYMTTAMVDRGEEDYSVESAVCKVFGSEACWRSVNESLQIAGGLGYMQEYPYEQALRDTRINLIFEGTNEILRLFLALSGMQGPGEQMKEIASALRTPLKSYGLLRDSRKEMLRLVLPQGVNEMFARSITRAHPLLKKEAALLEQHVSDLEYNVRKLFWKHGKKIIEMQFALKRVADVTIDLYGMACVLSRVTRAIEVKGTEAALGELQIAQAFFHKAHYRVRSTVKSFDNNNDEVLKDIAAKAYEAAGYRYEGVL